MNINIYKAIKEQFSINDLNLSADEEDSYNVNIFNKNVIDLNEYYINMKKFEDKKQLMKPKRTKNISFLLWIPYS